MASAKSGKANARDMDADAIVIGAGASGLCAALTLSLGGASVIVLEQMPECGGLTNYAEGMFAVESRMQKVDKVSLTVDEAFKTHMEETHWLANARLVRTFLERSSGTIDWLESLGAEFSDLFSISPYTPRVWHQLEGFGREGLIKPLYAKAQAEKGIRVLLESTARSLLTGEGRVVGVVAEDKDGNTVHAKARAVIIASGGYQDNKEWVDKYCKSGFTRPVQPAKQTGGPIQMAWEVGAAADGMGVMQTVVLIPSEDIGSQLMVAGYQPRLWVNQLGERFCDESICWKFPLAGNAVAIQPNAVAYCIFDEETKIFMKDRGIRYVLGVFFDISERLSDIDNELERGEKEGKVLQGSSLQELAEKIDVPFEAFVSTVDEYNECFDSNYDFIFGKDRTHLQPIRRPSLYAVRLGPAAFITSGGIKINHKTEVLNRDDKAIPGLYAVGCCAGGLFGDTYEVSTTGGSLSFAATSGRIAGESALGYMGK